MNNLEQIQSEVAELEAKRVLERAARALIEHAQGSITSVRLDASVEYHPLWASEYNRISKRVIAYIDLPKQKSYIGSYPTLSECLRELAAKYAPEKKGGE